MRVASLWPKVSLYSSSTSMARNRCWCWGKLLTEPSGSATVSNQRSTPSLLPGSHRRLKTMRRRQPSTSTSVLERRQALANPSNPKERQSSDSAHTSPAWRLSVKRRPSRGEAIGVIPRARCSEAIRVSTSPPSSKRPKVHTVRWRGLPSSLRKDSTSWA